jgi:hypothetical protein
MKVPRNKPLPAELKRQRGTLRPAREKGVIEIAAPRDPPMMPGWLTEAGKSAWLDNVGRVMQTGLGTELDSDLFANYCNLIGAIGQAWAAGEVPPGWAIGEARRLGELFGLAGARSRILRRPGEAGAPDPSNPFLNRSRPPGPESDRR